MKKRGRPIKEDAKRRAFNLRLTDDEAVMLNILSSETGKTMTEILRKGLEMQYKLHINDY